MIIVMEVEVVGCMVSGEVKSIYVECGGRKKKKCLGVGMRFKVGGVGLSFGCWIWVGKKKVCYRVVVGRGGDWDM